MAQRGRTDWVCKDWVCRSVANVKVDMRRSFLLSGHAGAWPAWIVVGSITGNFESNGN